MRSECRNKSSIETIIFQRFDIRTSHICHLSPEKLLPRITNTPFQRELAAEWLRSRHVHHHHGMLSEGSRWFIGRNNASQKLELWKGL